jgi:hypothetical protein
MMIEHAAQESRQVPALVTGTTDRHRGRGPARAVAVALALWAFGYACYRGYYAVGGTYGMIGQPVSDALFRTVNAVGAAIIFVAAILPPVALRFPSLRRALPVLAWIGAVGCCMHALVDVILRVFSIAGVHPTELPSSMWRSFDRHAADLQDLLLNEPWFLIEGLLWGALGILLVTASRRRTWLISAAAACLLLTVIGVLSGLDVIGSFVIL